MSPQNPIKGRTLAKNTLWNFAGQAIPLVVALVTIPILINKMGTDRFGILTIVWMITGYFSLFDLGLGRAMTQMIAEKLGKNEEDQIPVILQTALLTMISLGTIAGLLMAGIGPWAVSKFLNIPSGLEQETLLTIFLVAITIPFLIGATGIRGALEACQQFGNINFIRILIGSALYFSPILIFPFSHELPWVVLAIVLLRILSFILHVRVCRRAFPNWRLLSPPHTQLLRTLFGFGGWMTLSNVISPVMVQMDRFFIGATESMAHVAFYTTPFEVVTKILLIPQSLMGVLFPAFSTSLQTHPEKAHELFQRGIKYILLTLFPITAAVILFAPEALNLWVGPEFRRESSLILQILALGVFINSLANVPYTLLQGAGRPDQTAKLHLVELPIYLVLLLWLLNRFGINGVAIAWTLRTALDSILLFVLAKRVVSFSIPKTFSWQSLVVGLLLFGIWVSGNVELLSRVFGGSILLIAFVYITWNQILDQKEREFFSSQLRR